MPVPLAVVVAAVVVAAVVVVAAAILAVAAVLAVSVVLVVAVVFSCLFVYYLLSEMVSKMVCFLTSELLRKYEFGFPHPLSSAHQGGSFWNKFVN